MTRSIRFTPRITPSSDEGIRLATGGDLSASATLASSSLSRWTADTPCSILECTHFAEWRKPDNRAVPFTADQVRDYNGLQVMRSSQRVFCSENDFGLAREVCTAHPEIRDPNRRRVRVETTPIKDMKNYMTVTALE